MANPWKLKSEMCEVGRRMYERGLVTAFEGNLSARLGADRFLCTPSLVCKGTLKPEDLATVDSKGRQLSGEKKRTSEILLHLAIYRERPDVHAIVHAHPPHATAFAVTHQAIPSGSVAEMEVFVGEVPMAPYRTPGTAEFAESVVPYLSEANTVLLANHGTVSYGESLEQALFRTEILEGYCRMILLARSLGPVVPLGSGEMAEMFAVKKRLGIPDRRTGKAVPGANHSSPAARQDAPQGSDAKNNLRGSELDGLVREIAARIEAEMQTRSRGSAAS